MDYSYPICLLKCWFSIATVVYHRVIVLNFWTKPATGHKMLSQHLYSHTQTKPTKLKIPNGSVWRYSTNPVVQLLSLPLFKLLVCTITCSHCHLISLSEIKKMHFAMSSWYSSSFYCGCYGCGLLLEGTVFKTLCRLMILAGLIGLVKRIDIILIFWLVLIINQQRCWTFNYHDYPCPCM